MVGSTSWRLAVGPALFVLALAVSRVSFEVWGRVGAALTVAVVVVPAVLALGRGGLLALRRPRTALTGIGVVGGAAALVLAIDAALGGTRVEAVDVGSLALFVVVTLVLALLQEAVPEELAFRGLTFGVLARRGSAALAAVVTTVAFAASACAGTALDAVLVGAPVRIAPDGTAPLDYVVLLLLFGVVLVLLRVVTGSVWASVAAHVTFLLVNRVLVVSDGRATGVTVSSPPGAELLVPAYLVLAALGLGGVLAARSLRARRSAAA